LYSLEYSVEYVNIWKEAVVKCFKMHDYFIKRLGSAV
jgi:hypothetical protein